MVVPSKTQRLPHVVPPHKLPNRNLPRHKGRQNEARRAVSLIWTEGTANTYPCAWHVEYPAVESRGPVDEYWDDVDMYKE
jgi:hypothetical protein